jgi:RNA polymerase sigma-70 factor, ECF subfamily
MERGDAEVVSAVLAGDREAFRLLVERYHRPVLASARHILGDPELAQDAAQETFIEAFRGLGNLKDRAKFRPWLFGILRHRCLKVRDAAGPSTLTYDEESEGLFGAAPGPEEVAGEGFGQTMSDLLRELPREDRELLAARYLQQLSYAEIAVVLKITCTAVRVRCFRARERLRQIMTREQEQERENERCGVTAAAGQSG